MFKVTLSALIFATTVAGAQTVTVGSTTSSVNGTTTTITVPVSVAVPPVSSVGSSSMASLRVEVGKADGTPVNQLFTQAFKTIAFTNVIVDSASGWNSTTNTYTAPATGTYLIVSNIRLADFTKANVSYGQGVNTTPSDNQSFLWNTTSIMPRNGFVNSRIMQLSAGQSVSMFTYIDSPTPIAISGAILNIQQLQ